MGKRSVVSQFVENAWNPRLPERQSDSVDLAMRSIELYSHLGADEKMNVKLLVYHAPATDTFRSVLTRYYGEVQGIVVLYDVNDPQRVQKVHAWLESITQHVSLKNVVVFMAGNKVC